MQSSRRLRSAAARLASALAFGAAIAAVVVVLGTRDLESYEHVFFSLDRGTAVESVEVLGQPVYTLAVGLGVRLPLQGSLGASPAARLAPYLPAPFTYWLLLMLSIAAAALIVRHALDPLCGRHITWVALVLLFCSVPIVAYTIPNDWPEVAVTYCACIACVFAPHALLAARDAARFPWPWRVADLSVIGTVWGLVALSHPGYWPHVAAALVVSSAVALCRTEYPLRTRLLVGLALGAASLVAVVLQMPDIIRELSAENGGAMTRFVEDTRGTLFSANAFPFGEEEARMPFAYLPLAVVSLLIGLTSTESRTRRLTVVAAIAALVLGLGAATLTPGAYAYSPSNTWFLRDPAAALAVLSAACAVGTLRRSRDGRARVPRALALTGLAIAGLQGPAYAGTLLHEEIVGISGSSSWTQDLTPPGERAAKRGLPPDRIPPGSRLALWPNVRLDMRNRKQASTDFADAGYLVVTAWTKQRTMRQLVEPNEYLFNQQIELSTDVLCDPAAVRFLRLRYLLRPADVDSCAPWMMLPGMRVDGWLEVDIDSSPDARVWAVPDALLNEPVHRRAALSAGSWLLRELRPLPGTALTLSPHGAVTFRLGDRSVADGQAIVLPVAYDTAWRTSSGQVRDMGGLLAVVGADQGQVTLAFAPDRVAVLRAAAMTLAQMLAFAGLLGLAYVRPVQAVDALRLDPLLRRLGLIVAPVTAPLREPRNWWYVGFTLALVQRAVWPPNNVDRLATLAGLLLPPTAAVVARLGRRTPVYFGVSVGMLALALVRAAAGGSLAPAALHDPLFWALAAAVAVGLSAAVRRWARLAAIIASVAGVCTTLATLLPVIPGFESTFPAPTTASMRDAFLAVSEQFGTFATVCLFGLWVQAIAGDMDAHHNRAGIDAGVRGALLAALMLCLSGAIPQAGIAPAWIVGLGILAGLAEVKARQRKQGNPNAPNSPVEIRRVLTRTRPPLPSSST